MVRALSSIFSPAVRALVAATGVMMMGAGPSAGAGGTIHGQVLGDARYLEGTVVYLVGTGLEAAPPSAPPVVDQKSMQFVPRVLPVVKGTTVRFQNSDPTDHNVYSPDGETFNLGVWGQGVAKDYRFDSEGAYTLLCQIHPRMVGYVVVLDNPWFAMADGEGRFEISGVPAGDYEVAVWNERRRAEPVAVAVVDGGTSAVELRLER